LHRNVIRIETAKDPRFLIVQQYKLLYADILTYKGPGIFPDLIEATVCIIVFLNSTNYF